MLSFKEEKKDDFGNGKLCLRELKPEDFDRLHAIFSDEEIMRFYLAPFNREQTGQWIQKNQARYEKEGFGMWECV